MTIQDALNQKISSTMSQNILNATPKVEDILSFVLKQSREYLYAHPEKIMTPQQERRFFKFVDRFCTHEPIEYILHQAYFYGLELYVNRRVLIPRPETEILVEHILTECRDAKYHVSTIVDVGTGSGAIIIALAKNLKDTSYSFYAIDKSAAALRIAKKNAAFHDVDKRIKFLQGNLLEPLKNKKADIIVSNLPYLSLSEYQNSKMAAELRYEPKSALTDNRDGLTWNQKLIETSPKYLKPDGSIYMEIGYNQGHPLSETAKRVYPKSSIKIIKDLCGLDRIVRIKV